ncbi:congested-like trachea protein isoform X1 [Cotesia typhae]|uniref:congested-like trachea protein isoform X1 n=1 Tax=Cotesia typhae TaxID=2053667 RepID=UPI003D684962
MGLNNKNPANLYSEEDETRALVRDRPPGKYFIAGGFGGLCTTLCGHPLDTIKVRMQSKPSEYRNTWDAMSKIIQQEGPSGLYKGMMAPLVGIVPIFGLSFFSFNLGKKLVAEPNQRKENLTVSQLFLAGMFSGLATIPLSVPGERVKCLLQMQIGKKKVFHGFIDCALKLYRNGGVKNLYVGTGATLLRDLPASGVYFSVYDILMRLFANHFKETLMWHSIFAGGFAGMINWVVAMPADVLKSRLQTSSIDEYPRGMRSLLPKILRQEGPWALYRGVVPIMIRAIPANATCFFGIEVAMKILDSYFP